MNRLWYFRNFKLSNMYITNKQSAPGNIRRWFRGSLSLNVIYVWNNNILIKEHEEFIEIIFNDADNLHFYIC